MHLFLMFGEDDSDWHNDGLVNDAENLQPSQPFGSADKLACTAGNNSGGFHMLTDRALQSCRNSNKWAFIFLADCRRQ